MKEDNISSYRFIILYSFIIIGLSLVVQLFKLPYSLVFFIDIVFFIWLVLNVFIYDLHRELFGIFNALLLLSLFAVFFKPNKGNNAWEIFDFMLILYNFFFILQLIRRIIFEYLNRKFPDSSFLAFENIFYIHRVWDYLYEFIDLHDLAKNILKYSFIILTYTFYLFLAIFLLYFYFFKNW